ncbi:MAG: hypothetical protein L0211_19170 [Planctomycetaceae bacterium]|nr:hypothetical protein [Planctomycetaceae bacterium]
MPDASTKPKARFARWFQFRLGTLLLLITMLGVWLGIQVNRANRQRTAVAAITARKGLIKYDYQTDMNPKTVNPGPPGPKWLRSLIGDDYFCEVDWVTFATEYYGRRKELGLSKVDDEGLACLELIPTVTNLELGNNPAITDAGLVHLRNLKGLHTVYLYRTSVEGPGLVHFDGLKELRNLMLSKTPLTDEGMTHIGRLHGLTALDVDETRITDNGLASLRGLKQLRRLMLQKTRVTDAGLRHLYGMSSLEAIGLVDTKCSKAGIEELRRALPNCKIWPLPGQELTTD